MDDVVEFLRGDAGNDMLRQLVEDFSGEPAGRAHAGKTLRAVELDDASPQFGAVIGGDGDIFGHGPR